MKQDYQVSVFETDRGDEVFFAFCSKPELDFKTEAIGAIEQYKTFLMDHQCSRDSEVFLRFHMSDVTTQTPVLKELLGDRSSFVSYVGQTPIHPSRLAIEAYHIRSNKVLNKSISNENGSHELELNLNHYQIVFHCKRVVEQGSSYEQTQIECKALNDTIKRRDGSFLNNCLRTWFFARDIDNNYAGLVDARREYFEDIGITKETGYVASTGIEGHCYDPARLVGLDALCTFGLTSDQIVKMEVLSHMPPTHVYNVTFERGTRVVYGDRSHYYISGTASIDEEGNVMHPGDIVLQTKRMIENVDALLKNYEASLDDLKIACIFLRDSADFGIVEEELNQSLPSHLPKIIVKAPVCRPGWLIEMDGIAINKTGEARFPCFE